MKKAIILFSAGLDSTVSLALALEEEVQILQGLAFDYGQQAAESEWRQAQKLADHYQIPLQKISLPWLDEITETALSKSSKENLPEVSISQLDQVATVTLASANKVWVPNRNGLMINIAGAFADARGFDGIITGFNAEEAATFPDNTPQFSEAITRSLAFSTQTQPQVRSYVQHLNKVEIFQEALRLQVPIHLLWSCYRSALSHCGRCESCSRLKRAIIANEKSEYLPLLFGDDDA